MLRAFARACARPFGPLPHSVDGQPAVGGVDATCGEAWLAEVNCPDFMALCTKSLGATKGPARAFASERRDNKAGQVPGWCRRTAKTWDSLGIPLFKHKEHRSRKGHHIKTGYDGISIGSSQERGSKARLMSSLLSIVLG